MFIKYLQLNLWHGGMLWDNLLGFLHHERADIMVFQEAYNGHKKTFPNHLRTMERLGEEFPKHGWYFKPMVAIIRPEGRIDMGNAVFSRFPIVKSKSVVYNGRYQESIYGKTDFTKDPKMIQQVQIQVGQTKLNVLNNHGIWGFNGADNQARLAMSQMIINMVKDKKNVILSGDFNVRPDTDTIRNIEKHLTNVFKGKLKTSFNLKRKPKIGGYKDSVVDYIFTSRDIKVVKCSCLQVDVSDHLPLIAGIKI